MDAGASASARPAGLPVHDARPVGCAHPASRARPAGAAAHSRKGVGRGLDRPLAASAAGPRPAITSRRPVNSLKDRGRGLRGTEKRKMNTSVNELLSNPAFRPLVLLDVLAVFLMIICLVFRRMRKGYYVEQANDARKATMLNIAVRNVTGMGVYSAPGYWDNGDLNLCRFERANGDIVPGAVEADGEGGLRVYEITGGSHRSDFSYRLLGEAEYKEIWKKPIRRRF